MGVDQRQPNFKHRVAEARRQFDELMPPLPDPANSGATKPQQPDLIILHANHWTLKILAEGHIDQGDMGMASLPMLPLEYIEGYMRNVTLLAELVRETFPEAPMLYHTSSMVR